MRASLLVMGLLASPALAGCLAVDAPEESSPASDPLQPGADPFAPRDDDRARNAPSAGSSAASAAGWPAIDAAAVRPGVQVVSPTGQCTSNFVFASVDNATLFLGLAAHCVDGMTIGDAVEIAGGAATGTLAYSSWATMEEVGETNEDAKGYNDFALIAIDEGSRASVHPAMLHFGGPTALADSTGVAMGDKVLTYGNSGIRQGVDPAGWHEGYVLDHANGWTTEVYTLTPGVPGDSGSGVLDADGRALGVLVTLAIAPTTGSNGVTSLDLALAYAKEHAGLDARLATWNLLDAGVLPALLTL